MSLALSHGGGGKGGGKIPHTLFAIKEMGKYIIEFF